MKRPLSTLLLLIISSFSYADTQVFYLGAGIGQAYSFETETAAHDLSEVRGARLLTSQTTDYETQDVEQPSLSIFTGYRFTDWFALELEAFRHGRSQVEEQTDFTFSNGDTNAMSRDYELAGAGTALRSIFFYTVSEQFSVSLRAGLAWIRTKLEADAIPFNVEVIDNRVRNINTGAPATTERESNIKPTFGMAGSYSFNDHWSAALVWDRFLIPDGTIDRLEARAQYAF